MSFPLLLYMCTYIRSIYIFFEEAFLFLSFVLFLSENIILQPSKLCFSAVLYFYGIRSIRLVMVYSRLNTTGSPWWKRDALIILLFFFFLHIKKGAKFAPQNYVTFRSTNRALLYSCMVVARHLFAAPAGKNNVCREQKKHREEKMRRKKIGTRGGGYGSSSESTTRPAYITCMRSVPRSPCGDIIAARGVVQIESKRGGKHGKRPSTCGGGISLVVVHDEIELYSSMDETVAVRNVAHVQKAILRATGPPRAREPNRRAPRANKTTRAATKKKMLWAFPSSQHKTCWYASKYVLIWIVWYCIGQQKSVMLK